MVRAGIVGLGWWGKTLVNAVQGKSNRITFDAAYTRSPQKVGPFCRERGIVLHDSLNSLLADPAINAIVSTTPHSEHVEQIIRAAGAGKSIYIEKPLALSVASAERAIKTVRKAGTVLAVGYQRRFSPSHLDIKARIRAKSLGTIVHCAAEATASGALFTPAQSWRRDPTEMQGGAITPLGIHALDGIVDLLGPVDSLFCVDLKRSGGPVEDTTSVLLTLRNGASATLVSSMATARNYRTTVYGTAGLAEATRAAKESVRFVPVVAPSGSTDALPQEIEFPPGDLERASLEAFAAAVEGGMPFPIPADELLHVVAIFEALVRSAATHAPVQVAR
jgi:predicted dehydrogenase